MSSILAAAGMAAMQGARRHRLGAAAPTISISGTVLIGETLTASATDTTSYEWRRDGVAIPSATASTYVVTADDIGPEITCVATGPGGSTESNALVYDDAAHLPATAIGVSTAGLTLADSDTTVQSWAATLGGLAAALSAPTASQRPAHSATGGTGSRPLVTWDGTDDALSGTLTKGAAWDDYEFGVVGRQTSIGAANDRVMAYGTGGTPEFGINEAGTSGDWRVGVAGGVSAVLFTTDNATTFGHYSGDSVGGTQSARFGGTVENSSATTTPSKTDGQTLALGARPGADAQFGALELQAWYCGPALTSDQRTHLRALLTYHTGVSC